MPRPTRYETRPETSHKGLDLSAALAAPLRNDLLPPRSDDGVTGQIARRFATHLQTQLDNGAYSPVPAVFVPVPKPGFASRPAAALTLTDRIVYEALVASFRPALEAYLVPDGHLFWPRGEVAPKRWADVERSPLAVENAHYVVRADIAGFYDSIDHDFLHSDLVYATGLGDRASQLKSFLATVMRSRRGLPQGLSASDALATVYLQPVDAALVRQGYAYTRHGDDIRIATNTISQAREAIALFEHELRGRGLLVNAAKCTITTRATYQDSLGAAGRALESMASRLLADRVAHLESDDEALQEAMRAADLDSQVAWDLWYHGRISIAEVIEKLGDTIQPSSVDTAEALFDETMSAFDADPDGIPREQFHHQLVSALVRLSAGRSLFAVSRSAAIIARFPEKTELVCRYLAAVQAEGPREVAGQIVDVLFSDVYTTAWQKAWLLNTLGPVLPSASDTALEQLTELASSDGSDWLVRVEAMKALAWRSALTHSLATRAWRLAPANHRSEVLAAVCRMSSTAPWATQFVSVAHLDPIDKVVVQHVLAAQGNTVASEATDALDPLPNA